MLLLPSVFVGDTGSVVFGKAYSSSRISNLSYKKHSCIPWLEFIKLIKQQNLLTPYMEKKNFIFISYMQKMCFEYRVNVCHPWKEDKVT
jgi:hypothetical protein